MVKMYGCNVSKLSSQYPHELIEMYWSNGPDGVIFGLSFVIHGVKSISELK